jgi:DNA-directed RNA polymerase-5 subunit 1
VLNNDGERGNLCIGFAPTLARRSTTKGPQDAKRSAINTNYSHLSIKQWLDKTRILFISKGLGFSSCSLLLRDPYIGVDVSGLPSEVENE